MGDGTWTFGPSGGGDTLTAMPRGKRRNPRRDSTRTEPAEGVQRVRPPKARLKALLKLLVDVPKAAEGAIRTIEVPEEEAEKHLVMFDASILLRASNALKAVRLLCEEAHWEFAAPILRQLFELVINMEYLSSQPDREAAIFRHSKYGLLQEVRHQYLTLLYDQKTGREIDTQRLAILGQMLEQTFPEFRRVNAKGTVHWLPSWSGHKARTLAEQSKHRLRVNQYDLLFSAWSEQAHAAPAALMENMFPRGLSAEEIVASDDVEIVQTVMLAVTLFLEIWVLLPHVPQADATQRLKWTDAMIEEARKHGAPFPTQAAADEAEPDN
jgi:hypothetical protein